jgi:hypothetical protein
VQLWGNGETVEREREKRRGKAVVGMSLATAPPAMQKATSSVKITVRNIFAPIWLSCFRHPHAAPPSECRIYWRLQLPWGDLKASVAPMR